jgi:hypothetical protein
MTQRTVIEQRIGWTRFRRQTDKDVLLALARWFCWRADGSNVRPSSIPALAAKSGVKQRSVERALARLIKAKYLRVTATQNRGTATYQIVLEQLATEDPDRVVMAVDNTRDFDRHNGGRTKEVADETDFDRHNGGRTQSGGRENIRNSEKVADPYRSEEVVGEEICTPPPPSVRDRHCGGRAEVVAAFAAWWTATYPDYNEGAQNPIDVAHHGVRIQKLFEAYPDDLQAMVLLMWQLVADGNPKSHRSWIANETDRGLGVLERKADFLHLSLSAPEQLTFGPMVHFSDREIAEAKRVRSFVYGGCPHDPRCDDFRECVKEIALARRVG